MSLHGNLLGPEPTLLPAAPEVDAALEAGADPTIRDAIHGGMADGWAEFGGHPEIADYLRSLR
jgi:hypothetical protein